MSARGDGGEPFYALLGHGRSGPAPWCPRELSSAFLRACRMRPCTSAKIKAGIFTGAEQINTRLRPPTPLSLPDDPGLMTLKDDGLVPVADTFPAEPLRSWRGIYSPTASTQDRAPPQHCPCAGTRGAQRGAWHGSGAGASTGTSRSPPRGTTALAALL